ncbi:hypothetical protein EJ08DRAFT_389529 [Tothia fuscella]|uniref:Uncharacterized protein n=1 Tax=Tothia fuscella TaxID=1048955 RepID=A0A9P4U305_9PEZI|nr:hypothetical protein EJ08DRAFT_389529 [Tothia fuscella]
MPLGGSNWLWRGFQSAVFRYVSCAPCYEKAYKRKRKREAKRDKKRYAEMAHIYAEQGHSTQPAPFEVNPYWSEEIQMGPGPWNRKKGKKPVKRDITTASSNSTAESSVNDLARPSSSTPEPKFTSWNSRRYQRADEEFTYLSRLEEVPDVQDGLLQVPGSSKGTGNRNAQPEAKIQKPEQAYWQPLCAPEVSELHPPATSTVPIRKSERNWMTQAPPSAAFMEGKKPQTNVTRRSTASSKATKRTTISEEQLARMIIDDGSEFETASRVGQRRTHILLNGERAQSRTASASPMRRGNRSLEKDRVSPRKVKRRPAPLHIVASSSDSEDQLGSSDSEDTGLQLPVRRRTIANQPTVPQPTLSPLRTRQINAQRPQLSTTRSYKQPSTKAYSSIINNENDYNTPGAFAPISPSPISLSPRSSIPKNRTPSPVKKSIDDYTPSPRKRKDTVSSIASGEKPRLFLKDSSLQVLQNLVEPSSLLNSKFIRSPTIEAKIPLPVENSSPEKVDTPQDDGKFWLSSHIGEDIAWTTPSKRWSTGGVFDLE